MNAYELADDLENSNGLQYITKVGLVSLSAQMLRQQADRIAELEKSNDWFRNNDAFLRKEFQDQNKRLVKLKSTPQIKELSDEENNLKWWISSFEHLKALGGGISDEIETKLKEMQARLKKASEK